MKLNASKNLDKFRDAAKALLAQHYAKLSQRNPYLMVTHNRKTQVAHMYIAELEQFANALKAKVAEEGQTFTAEEIERAALAHVSPPVLLAHEAQERGLSVKELAITIATKAQEAANELDALEIRRQNEIARINAAPSVEHMGAVIGVYGLQFEQAKTL